MTAVNKTKKFASGVQVTPVSRKELRHQAGEIRKWLKLEDVDYLPVPQLLEVFQAAIEDFEFFICNSHDLPKNIFATYTPKGNCIVIKKDIYDMACRGNGFARWTITHEISHYILHRNQLSSLTRKTNNPHRFYEDSEWQANTLACELLIPHYRLHGGMTVDEVSQRFGVTPAAATVVIKQMGKHRRTQ